MSTMPMYQQQQEQPPPMSVTQHSPHESIGPVIGVLVVVIVLGVIAVMIGRLCSGRRIMGHGQYDVERWAELVLVAFRSDLTLNNKVIEMDGNCKSTIDAHRVFDHMPNRNMDHWHL